jgi:large subunit ribosomal protein L19
MNKNLLIKQVTESQLRSDLPNIEVGENIEVISKLFDNKNKDKFKLISFKGTVIACNRRNLISYNFSVVKESNKAIIKKIFFFHSPLITEIKKTGRIKNVRRAKLFYLERMLSDKKSKS